MKTVLLIIISSLLITVTGYSQFWIGESLSTIQSKVKLNRIEDDKQLAYGNYEYLDGPIAYYFTDNICTSMLFIPLDNTVVQEYVSIYNAKLVILSKSEWMYYGTDVVHIYLLQDPDDSKYYFVFQIEEL